MFQHTQSKQTSLCESCYRRMHYGDPSFTKIHKHNCLEAEISSEDSQKICLCPSVPRHGDSGPRPLFPVDEIKDKKYHLNTQGTPGKLRCGLYELTDLVAEAKFASTRLNIDKQKTLRETRRDDVAQEAAEPAKTGNKTTITTRPSKIDGPSLVEPNAIIAEFGNTSGVTDDSYESIPSYLRPVADKYPYGNVHMALSIGPLVIENGVEKYKILRPYLSVLSS